jgi:hypothetical protein
MEGPQFSCCGVEGIVVGHGRIRMTNLQEAKLARGGALLRGFALVTDYDCWHPDTTR